MNCWVSVMNGSTNSSGMNKPLNPCTKAYPANHHKAGRGRRKQTCGYKRQVLKNRRPARRDRDEAPGITSPAMASKGIVNTTNKKAPRRIFALVFVLVRIYILLLGRVEGCVVSRRSPVSVCCITEESYGRRSRTASYVRRTWCVVRAVGSAVDGNQTECRGALRRTVERHQPPARIHGL